MQRDAIRVILRTRVGVQGSGKCGRSAAGRRSKIAGKLAAQHAVAYSARWLPSSSPRILILNWKDPFGEAAGGSELYVRRIAEAWSARGADVTVFVPRTPGAPASQMLSGVRYERQGSLHTVFPLARRHLRRHRAAYDLVVESVSVRPFFAHSIVGDHAVALVHHIAREVWNREFSFPTSWVGRHLVEPHWLRRLGGSRVVAVSDSTAADLQSCGIGVEAIVHPGCDQVSMQVGARTAPDAHPRLLFVGRLLRAKRPHDAIEAFATLRDAWPGATLDLLGGGYMLSELLSRNDPGVAVQGFVPDSVKHRALSSAHLLLLPATREGWGIVAMEAGIHGVPVVAYDVPGLRESVIHDKTGLLTESTPAALAAAAAALLRSPATWRRMSQAARARAQTMTWEATAGQLIRVADPAVARRLERDLVLEGSRSVAGATTLQLGRRAAASETEEESVIEGVA